MAKSCAAKNCATRLVYLHSRSNEKSAMNTTRAFVFAAHADERTDIDLKIDRKGDEVGSQPARRLLFGVLVKLAQFSPEFMAEGRGEHEQAERDIL